MPVFLSMTDLVRSQVEPHLRLAWFLYEAIEREHRLNLQALSATHGAFVVAWMRMLTVAGGARADAPSRPPRSPGLRAKAGASATSATDECPLPLAGEGPPAASAQDRATRSL
ncbi:hypothetical protein [Piscinibacter sp. XHJ-5]|uniref:hypothetical protein n=1 Tax=Piscinibacter sp. XHJ-5 TaxID=3037797 RepID=UPI002452A185|nr:hypothetical protein [Piscinibacter sp. XHJ-5]